MKTPFYKHPQFAKWGLYSLLLASLGFTISMNPDHYNNIVRHYPLDKAGVLFFASEVAPGKPEGAKDFQFYRLDRNKAVVGTEPVKGYFFNTNGGQTCAKLTEGADGSTRCGLQHSPDNMNKFAEELSAILGETAAPAVTADGAVTPAAANPAPTAPVPTTTEMAMDEIIAAWAKKCDSKTDEDSKMECHRDQIVALSEHKKAKETHVTAYFDKYLKSTLKRMWESNPIPSFSRFTGYTPSAGAEKHEKADEIYEHLLQELNTTNGNGAREKMMTVYQNAFAAQARHAQALCRSHDENLRRKCPEMFDYLSHNDLESFGRLTVSGLNGANFADDADRISLLERYDNNIYSPLDAWFRDIYASKTPLDQVSFIAIPQSMDAYYRSSASSQTSNATVDVIKARLAAERARTWEIATAGSGTLNSQGRFTEPMPYFSLGNTTGVTGPNAGNVPSPLQQQNGVQQPTTQNFDRVGSGQIPYGRGGQQGTF